MGGWSEVSRGPGDHTSNVTYCPGTLYRRRLHTMATCLYDFIYIFLETSAKPGQKPGQGMVLYIQGFKGSSLASRPVQI